MRYNWLKKGNRIVMGGLSALLAAGAVYGGIMVTKATPITDSEDKIKDYEDKLDDIDDRIDDLSDEQEVLLEEMDDLNAEILNMLTEIGMLEDDIAEAEKDIADLQTEYEAAVVKQQEQTDAMTLRIQLMYERGDSSFTDMIMESVSFGDMMNKMAYAEAVLEYDNQQLDAFVENKNYVLLLWDTLEIEKLDLESDKAQLEAQKAYCDGLMAEMQKKSDNYDALIAKAKQEAKATKEALQKEKNHLKKLKEEERKRLEEEKRKQQPSISTADIKDVGYSGIIDGATGSDLGKKIAKYACQFVGNPYVAGGTSLTQGADCSGFTYRIYSNFNYSIPRTSFQQRSAGVGVDYANAQPGDLICYSGHVAMYIGDGYIVHASNKKTGIKISKATYREILAVRRII